MSYWEYMKISCAGAMVAALALGLRSVLHYWFHQSAFWIVEALKMILLALWSIWFYRQVPAKGNEPEKAVLAFRAILGMAAVSIMSDAGV